MCICINRAIYNRRFLKKGNLGKKKKKCFTTKTIVFSISDPNQNLLEVLQNVVRQEGISKAKKLGYFNAFVRLVYRFGSNFQTHLSKEQILCWYVSCSITLLLNSRSTRLGSATVL